jgi:nucleoside phosphorylase
MASGSSVLADGEFVKLIKSQHRKVLGIEMESYAVYAAASEAFIPKPLPISVKFVVDYADGSKNDDLHGFGAFCSAQVVTQFIERVA